MISTVLLIVLLAVLDQGHTKRPLLNKIRNRRNRGNDVNPSDENTRSNVLFIIVDDLGWADVPSHNNNEYTLPVIESEIYAKGVEFTSYYTAPVCTPTRASFLTGKYAWKLGMQDVQTMPPCVDERIPRDTPTIAEVLRNDLGYATYYVGKWHLGYAKWSDTPIGRGFDYAYGYLQGEGDYYDHTMHLNESHGYDMFDMDLEQPAADWSQVDTYATDIYDRKAQEYLSKQIPGGENADKPFYMYLSYQTIHEPIQIPTDNAYANECANSNLDDNRVIYCQKMKYLDDSIGNVINYLKNNNLYDNTLIIFTTDNGGMVLYDREIAHPNAFYMPNSYGCNWPYRAGKATLFEGGIRAIGLVAGSFIQDTLQGTQSSLLLHAVDWFTTILEGAAGVENTQEFLSNYNDGLTFDGLNVLDYLVDPTCSTESCQVEFPRDYIIPNVDVTNALMPADPIEVEVTRTFRFRKMNITTTEIETLDINGMYGEMPFDVILYYDQHSDTLWKYMRGYQLYYNYYDCTPTLQNSGNNYVASDTWETTEEWLFNLSENPYEYESLNYLSSNFQGTPDNGALLMGRILRTIVNEVQYNNQFLAEQDTTFDATGMPGCSGGTFEPWLYEDGTNMHQIEECTHCDFNCVMEAASYTSG